MIIVHYTLGLFPKRIGGLNRYATDLMMEQSRMHTVLVLIPGSWKPWSNKCSIKYIGNYKHVRVYHLRNALPLPLLYGIKNPQKYINNKIDFKSFEQFFEIVKPNVLHLHTLMGMPELALAYFKEKGVRIVYTSHDYFGICLKVNLIDKSGKLCEGPIPHQCALCNEGAPSSLFLRLRNSNLAFILRDLLRWIRDTRHS